MMPRILLICLHRLSYLRLVILLGLFVTVGQIGLAQGAVFPSENAVQERLVLRSGSMTAVRLRVQDLFLSTGIGVSSIAACDCLVTSDMFRFDGMPSSNGVLLRVHILKPINGISVTVVIDGVVGRVEGAPVRSIRLRQRSVASVESLRILTRQLADSLRNDSFAKFLVDDPILKR